MKIITCRETSISTINTAALGVVEQMELLGEKKCRFKEMSSHFVMLK
jgi:hypothetical protein